MYQMAILMDKLAVKIPASSIARPSQTYPNWYFWFENIPSGNTGENPGKIRTVENC
jgi:hypothetical protein